MGVNKGCHLQRPKSVLLLLLLSDSSDRQTAVGCRNTVTLLFGHKEGQNLAQAAIKLGDIGQEGTGLLCSIAVVVQSLPVEVGCNRLIDQEGNLNMHCQPGDVLVVPCSCNDRR